MRMPEVPLLLLVVVHLFFGLPAKELPRLLDEKLLLLLVVPVHAVPDAVAGLNLEEPAVVVVVERGRVVVDDDVVVVLLLLLVEVLGLLFGFRFLLSF